MCNVTIVCNSTCQGRIGPGAYCYTLVYKDRKREEACSIEITTRHHAQLKAIVEALGKLKFPCDVTVVSNYNFVSNNVNRWQKLGEDKETWTQLEHLMTVHNVLFDKQQLSEHTAEVAERKKNFVCLRNAGFNTL